MLRLMGDGWFMSVLKVFHMYFKCDSNVFFGCFKVLEVYFSQRKLRSMCTAVFEAIHTHSLEQEHPQNTLDILTNHIEALLKYSWNKTKVKSAQRWNLVFSSPLSHCWSWHFRLCIYILYYPYYFLRVKGQTEWHRVPWLGQIE